MSNNRNIEYQLETAKHPSDPSKMLVQLSAKLASEDHSQTKPRAPQHHVFVIDRSGSMAGAKLEAVKTAAQRLIQDLPETDTLSVVTFDDDANVLLDNVALKTEMKAKANTLINGITAGKGTNIRAGINKIGGSDAGQIKLVDPNESYVLFFTDGEDTTTVNGETLSARNVDSLLEALKVRCGTRALPHFISIGMGDTYNAALLTKMSEYTGVRTTVHIKDAADVNNKFVFVQNLIDNGVRTQPVQLQLTYPGRQEALNLNIGSLVENVVSKYVIEVLLPAGHDTHFPLHITDRDGQLILSESSNIQLDQLLPANSAMMAQFVVQRLEDIRDISNKEKRIEKLKELLPLLPLKDDDSDFVKMIRQSVKAAISASVNNNINDLRNVVSVATATTMIGGHGPQTMIGNEKLKAAYGNEFDETKQTLNIDGELHPYHIISQMLDYVEVIKRGERFFSYDPAGTYAYYIDPNSTEILKLCTQANSFNAQPEQTLQEKLKSIVDSTAEAFSEQIKDLQSLITQIENPGDLKNNVRETIAATVSYDECLSSRYGNCREQTILANLALAHFIVNNELPPGTIRQYRGISIDGLMSHTWGVYKPKDGQGVYFIDPTNKKGSKVYNLLDVQERRTLIEDYKKRNLDGILDYMLSVYPLPKETLAQLDANVINELKPVPIPDELIASIKDDKIFVDKGLIDHGTQVVMSDPVRIAGQPKQFVFERSFIEQWFALRAGENLPATNPVTRLPCSTELIPAIDVRNNIVALILQTNNVLPPSTAVIHEKMTERKQKTAEKLQEFIAQQKNSNGASSPISTDVYVLSHQEKNLLAIEAQKRITDLIDHELYHQQLEIIKKQIATANESLMPAVKEVNEMSHALAAVRENAKEVMNEYFQCKRKKEELEKQIANIKNPKNRRYYSPSQEELHECEDKEKNVLPYLCEQEKTLAAAAKESDQKVDEAKQQHIHKICAVRMLRKEIAYNEYRLSCYQDVLKPKKLIPLTDLSKSVIPQAEPQQAVGRFRTKAIQILPESEKINGFPKNQVCPLSLEPMSDPVAVSYCNDTGQEGITYYQRSVWEAYLKSERAAYAKNRGYVITDFLTGFPLKSQEAKPAEELKYTIGDTCKNTLRSFANQLLEKYFEQDREYIGAELEKLKSDFYQALTAMLHSAEIENQLTEFFNMNFYSACAHWAHHHDTTAVYDEARDQLFELANQCGFKNCSFRLEELKELAKQRSKPIDILDIAAINLVLAKQFKPKLHHPRPTTAYEKTIFDSLKTFVHDLIDLLVKNAPLLGRLSDWKIFLDHLSRIENESNLEQAIYGQKLLAGHLVWDLDRILRLGNDFLPYVTSDTKQMMGLGKYYAQALTFLLDEENHQLGQKMFSHCLQALESVIINKKVNTPVDFASLTLFNQSSIRDGKFSAALKKLSENVNQSTWDTLENKPIGFFSFSSAPSLHAPLYVDRLRSVLNQLNKENVKTVVDSVLEINHSILRSDKGHPLKSELYKILDEIKDLQQIGYTRKSVRFSN